MTIISSASYEGAKIIARLVRGYRRMWDAVLRFVLRFVPGRRGYRFEGERANHADQAAQTNVSIGLMAAAAKRSDDDSLRQQMQTERTLRDRLGVLNGHRAERGLTPEEDWERASIIKGLREIGSAATPTSHGPLKLRQFAAVNASGGVLGAISSVRVWVWLSAALVAMSGLWMFERAGKMRVVDQRDEWRARAQRNAQEADEWRREYEGAHNEVIQANQQAAVTARRLDMVRREAEALRRRQQERARDAQNVLTRNQPPDWDQRLLDLSAAGPVEARPDRDPGAGGDSR